MNFGKNYKYMFDYTFIDLDKTLFDCRRLEEEIWKICERVGVARDDYWVTYRKALCTVNPKQFDYTFEEHLKFLADLGYKLDGKVLTELEKLLQNNYLFSDSLDLIKFLREKSRQLILLTAGDVEFQRKKIANSKITDFFDEVKILSGYKEKYVAEKFQGNKKGLFVNDSLRENLLIKSDFPEILVITKLYHGSRHEEEVKKSGLPYFYTLSEIKDYVAQL